MKWYIGQRIVAIKDHPDGDFKKGQIFVVHGLSLAKCNCRITLIDIGYTAPFVGVSLCKFCNTAAQGKSNIKWYSEHRFAPRDEDNYENVDISELTEILQQPLITTQ